MAGAEGVGHVLEAAALSTGMTGGSDFPPVVSPYQSLN